MTEWIVCHDDDYADNDNDDDDDAQTIKANDDGRTIFFRNIVKK